MKGYLSVLINLAICKFVCLFNCQSKRNYFSCTNKNLFEFPKAIIRGKEIFYMDLSSNRIQTIHEDDLMAYNNLQNLTLNSNKIWKITANAFNNQKKLKMLSLRDNALLIRLDSFSAATFINLGNLEYLDLSKNPLGIIPNGFFLNLPKLKDLYLEETVQKIKIMRGAFSKLHNLKKLSLAGNGFTTLPDYLLENLEEMPIETLMFHNNPWMCDCHLRWFKIWLIRLEKTMPYQMYEQLKNSVRTAYPMFCYAPPSLHGKLLFDQNLTHFECQPIPLHKGRIVISKKFDNVSISCNFTTYPKSYVRWFKNGVLIQKHWPRMQQTSSLGLNVSGSLIIRHVQFGIDEGSYVCETANSIGIARINFTLVISNETFVGEEPSGTVSNQNAIFILILIASGVIVMIVSLGITVYCLYGRNYSLGKQKKCSGSSNLIGLNDRIQMPNTRLSISANMKNNNFYQLFDKTTETVEAASPTRNGLNGFANKYLDEPFCKKHEMENKSFILYHNSDTESCDYSFHEECPVHGYGNPSECPVHGSTNV